MIQNKAPGKDISHDDMKEKFPLASKKIILTFLNLKSLGSHSVIN